MCDKLPAAASPAPTPASTPTNQNQCFESYVIFAAESNPVALIHALRASSAKTAGPEKATVLS
jgi:hypothetical protein